MPLKIITPSLLFSGPQPTFGPIQTEDSDNQEMHRHPDRERVPRKKRRLQGHLPVCGLVMSSLRLLVSWSGVWVQSDPKITQ